MRMPDINHPMKAGEQHRPDADEQPPHNERAEDAVEQHAVLADRRHLEVLEDEHHDEDVVDAQRLFDHVAGEERQRGVMTVDREQSAGEGESERNPDRHP